MEGSMTLRDIGIIVAIATGTGGLALGLWTRIEQMRETREHRLSRRPFLGADIGSPDNGGWRPVKLWFYNPSDFAFQVTSVEARTSVAELAPTRLRVGDVGYAGGGYEPDVANAGCAISESWEIGARIVPNSPAQRLLFCRFCSNSLTLVLRVNAREISPKRRKFHMQAEATAPIAAP
jgi:hypothetical protein